MIRYENESLANEDVDAILIPTSVESLLTSPQTTDLESRFKSVVESFQKDTSRQLVQFGVPTVYEISNISQPYYALISPLRKKNVDIIQLNTLESFMDEIVKTVSEMNLRSIAIPLLREAQDELSHEQVREVVCKKIWVPDLAKVEFVVQVVRWLP